MNDVPCPMLPRSVWHTAGGKQGVLSEAMVWMTRTDWGARLASGGAVASVLFAVWAGGMSEDGVQKAANNPEGYFVAHMVAGTLGVVASLHAYRGPGLPRLLLGVGALL